MYCFKSLNGRRKGEKSASEVDPIGSAFAISDYYVFTACHHVMTMDGEPLEKIALVREFKPHALVRSSILEASLVMYCADFDEDFAIYRRDRGTFAHYAHICKEEDLPRPNQRIGIKDFPIGLLTSGSGDEVCLRSVRTKVSDYDILKDPTQTKKRKRVHKFTMLLLLLLQRNQSWWLVVELKGVVVRLTSVIMALCLAFILRASMTARVSVKQIRSLQIEARHLFQVVSYCAGRQSSKSGTMLPEYLIL
jgi:hypothetical protein